MSFKSEVLWLLQHLQDSCQAPYRLIQPPFGEEERPGLEAVSEAGMEIRMAKEEDVSSHKKESEDAFPRDNQACVRPSLTCIYTGGLTKIPEGPSRAESPFTMWLKEAQVLRVRALSENKAAGVQSAASARSEWRT